MAGKNDRVVAGTMVGDLIVLDNQGHEVARFNDLPKTKIVADISVSDNGKVFTYALHELYTQIRYVTIDTKKKSSFKGLFNGTNPGYGSNEPIGQIALSSDGKYVAMASGEGSKWTLSLYASNGTRLWSKDIVKIRDISITANGSSVFAGTGNGDIISYTRSGNLSWLYSSGSPVTSLSLITDSNLFVAGNGRGDIHLFNETGTLLWSTRIEEFPVGEISQVELSRNGEALAVLVNNKNIYYFEKEAELIPAELPQIEPTQTRIQESAVALPIINFSSLLRWRTPDFTTVTKQLYPTLHGNAADTADSAPVWLDGWQFRKSHTISGSPSQELTNYPMKFVVYRTNGSDDGQDVYVGEQGCQPDYADIRFYTDSSEGQLDYWIESSTPSSAVIWVKIPVIPLNGTEIRMYYGNANAGRESNAEATFLFFDHFDEPNLDTEKWNISGTPTIANSIIELNTTKGYAFIVSNTVWPVNTSFTSYGIMDDTINNTYQGYYNNSGPYLMFYPSNPNLRAVSKYNSTKTTSLGEENDGWTRSEIIRNSTYSVDYLINGSVVATHENPQWISKDPISILLKGTVNSRFKTDYLFVRPYVFPEPAHSIWSAEESSSTLN